MNLKFWKKTKEELSVAQMNAEYNVFMYQQQRLKNEQIGLAMELDRKRDPSAYIR